MKRSCVTICLLCGTAFLGAACNGTDDGKEAPGEGGHAGSGAQGNGGMVSGGAGTGGGGETGGDPGTAGGGSATSGGEPGADGGVSASGGGEPGAAGGVSATSGGEPGVGGDSSGGGTGGTTPGGEAGRGSAAGAEPAGGGSQVGPGGAASGGLAGIGGGAAGEPAGMGGAAGSGRAGGSGRGGVATGGTTSAGASGVAGTAGDTGGAGQAGAGGAAGGAQTSIPGNEDSVGFGVRKAIVIDGSNTAGEWGDDTLLIRDPAADDARFLGSNWCAHEVPWDHASLHAAWDDDHLYVGIQYVNVTDVVDPASLANSTAWPLYTADFVQFLVFDTGFGGYAEGGDMWGREFTFVGSNRPDYQLYFHSNFAFEALYWGEWNGAEWVAGTDGSQTPSLRGDAGDFFVGQTLPGVSPSGDDATPGHYGSEVIDYLQAGHSTAYDAFFELQIPLALLGLPSSYLDGETIGLFASQGNSSAVDSIPNDLATSSTPGVSSSNSPLEWDPAIDDDQFSAPFALVGTR